MRTPVTNIWHNPDDGVWCIASPTIPGLRHLIQANYVSGRQAEPQDIEIIRLHRSWGISRDRKEALVYLRSYP